MTQTPWPGLKQEVINSPFFFLAGLLAERFLVHDIFHLQTVYL